MDIGSWLQIVVICFLGAISPGPSLALVVTNTVDRGASYGVATGFGHGTGIALWAFLTAAGMSKFVMEISMLSMFVQMIGALLLVYIGYRTLTSVGDLSLNQRGTRSGRFGFPFLLKGAGEGFLVSILNPKIALFFMAIFSHFIHPDVDWLETMLIGIVAGTIDAFWYMAVAFTLAVFGMTRISHKGENVIKKISGGLLLMVAVYLLAATFI